MTARGDKGNRHEDAGHQVAGHEGSGTKEATDFHDCHKGGPPPLRGSIHCHAVSYVDTAGMNVLSAPEFLHRQTCFSLQSFVAFQRISESCDGCGATA